MGIIALVLIIGIGLFLANRNAASPAAQNPQDSGTPAQTPAAASGTKQYSDAFGFTVTYPESYVVSTDGTGIVTFNVSGPVAPITIVKTNNSAPDPSGKWGPYTISYANNGYVVTQQNEQDGSMASKSITPIAYTTSGLPIFNGGIPSHGFGKYDYVVALSHTKFLTVSGPDTVGSAAYSASADPTFAIAKSVALR